MKKVFLVMILFGVFVFGNNREKSSFEIIKDRILEHYKEQKFINNYIFGKLTESGIETFNGYNIDSDDVYIFSYGKDENPYTGRFYNRIENGEMKDGKLTGKYIKTFMDNWIITRNYENGIVVEIKKEKELKILRSKDAMILENEFDCIVFIYPDFTYKFENKKLNGKVKGKKCSFELKEGKLHGKYLSYYENSDLKHFELNYEEGKRHGSVINWDKNGNVIYENTFDNGNGELKLIYDDMIIYGNYKENKLHGKAYTDFIEKSDFKYDEYYFYGVKILKEENFDYLNKLEQSKKMEKIPEYLKKYGQRNTLEIMDILLSD